MKKNGKAKNPIINQEYTMVNQVRVVRKARTTKAKRSACVEKALA